MKTLIKWIGISCVFLPHLVQAKPVPLALDLKKSQVRWVGKFMGADVKAQLKFKSGQFATLNGKLQSGKIVADMKSISSDSGMDDTFKGPMFLNVDQYPTVELVIEAYSDLQATAKDPANARAKGTIMFRGKTHPVKGDFVLTPDKKGFHVIGTFKTVYGGMVSGDVTYEIWAK